MSRWVCPSVLQRFELEHDNFRAAVDFAVAHDAGTAARLASALGELWTQRGYLSEGRERLDRCLQVATAAGQSHCPPLLAATNLALRQGDYGGCRLYLGQLESASRRAGDRTAEAHSHDLLGRIAIEEGALDRADDELDRAMRLFLDIKDYGGAGRVHWHLHMLALVRGDLEVARRHVEPLVAVCNAIGSPWAIGHAHLALAQVEFDSGDLSATRNDLEVALTQLTTSGDRWALSLALRLAAALAVARTAAEHGLVLLGAGEALDEAIGAHQGPRMLRFIARWEDRARQRTAPAAARAALARGRRMTQDEAVELALQVACSDRDTTVAAGLTRRELEVARLMAAGATDREICERLGVSIRTIEKHAENVRAKLGVESRTAVAKTLTAT